MYFYDKKKHENSGRTLITREINLIDDFRANFLIENDVLNFETFDIFISTYIESCNVNISIFIKNRSNARTILIHATKAMIILSRTKQTIFIHKISLLDRHHNFELTEANFQFTHT